MHASGALLLDYRDGERYDAHLRSTAPHPSDQMFGSGHPAAKATAPGEIVPSAAGVVCLVTNAARAEDDDDDDDGGAAGGADDDDEDMGPEAGAATAIAVGAAAVAAGEAAAQVPPKEAVSGMPGAPLAPAGRIGAEAPAGGTQEEEDEEEFFDPYRPLNADVPGDLLIRPMQVGGGMDMQAVLVNIKQGGGAVIDPRVPQMSSFTLKAYFSDDMSSLLLAIVPPLHRYCPC